MPRVSRSVMALAAWAVPTLAAADPITVTLSRGGVARTLIGANEIQEAQQGGDVSVTSLQVSGLNSASSASELRTLFSDNRRNFSGTAGTDAIAESGDESVSAFAANNATWRFRLDEPHLFDFVGAFTITQAQFSPIGWLTFLAESSGLPGTLKAFSHFGEESRTLSEHGRLAPGEYLFSIFSESRAAVRPHEGRRASRGDFRFSLDLIPAAEPVPEPASVALLGSGLLAVLAAARRQAQSISSGDRSASRTLISDAALADTEPFDHPDAVFEPELHGFRVLVYVLGRAEQAA